jgi:gluconate kinase
MSNHDHPVDAMIRQLRALRDNVAALARNEKDGLSYRAYLLQARSLLSIEEAAGSLHADASIKAMREDMTDEAHVERYWLEMVADWLTEHEKACRDSLEGGSTEKLSFLLSAADKGTVRGIHAQRHHAMIENFCKSHAATLRERCDELDAGVMSLQRMPGPNRTGGI